MMLQVGDVAPDFELPSHKGGKVRLSEFRDLRNVLVFFHPLAWTPVCARQACRYEADRSAYEQAHARVLGISVDSVPAEAAWAQSLGGISYDLLSDFHPRGQTAAQYGVLRPDTGFPDRAVFVVDKNGRIAYARVFAIPSEPDYAEALAKLEDLKGR